jgi:hypothetical protein
MELATLICWAVCGYAVVGLLFGVWFCLVGAGRLDGDAKGAGVGFRLLILPGVVGLWPVVVGKVLAGRRGA